MRDRGRLVALPVPRCEQQQTRRSVMGETLEKLRPDRDLQCFFQRPSAVAALSETSPSGFTVSGSWRQQFDWGVIEWNRDKGYENPPFRNLPRGDLRGLALMYDEAPTPCLAVD